MVQNIEAVARAALVAHQFEETSFYLAWVGLGGDFTMLYRMYMGKATLNRFRQEKGDKTGGYQRIWRGKEDNYYLAKIISDMPADTPDQELGAYIFDALAGKYMEMCPPPEVGETIAFGVAAQA